MGAVAQESGHIKAKQNQCTGEGILCVVRLYTGYWVLGCGICDVGGAFRFQCSGTGRGLKPETLFSMDCHHTPYNHLRPIR